MKNKEILKEIEGLLEVAQKEASRDYDSRIPFCSNGYPQSVQRMDKWPFAFACGRCGEMYTSENNNAKCPNCGNEYISQVYYFKFIEPKRYAFHFHKNNRDYILLLRREVYLPHDTNTYSYKNQYYTFVRDEKGDIAIFNENGGKSRSSDSLYTNSYTNIMHLDNGLWKIGFSENCSIPRQLKEELKKELNQSNARIILDYLKTFNSVDIAKVNTDFGWNKENIPTDNPLKLGIDYQTVYDIDSNNFPVKYSCGHCNATYIKGSVSYGHHVDDYQCEKCNTVNYYKCRNIYYSAQAYVDNGELLILFKPFSAVEKKSKIMSEENGDMVIFCINEEAKVSFKKYTVRGWEYTNAKEAHIIPKTKTFHLGDCLDVIKNFEPIKRTGWLEYSASNPERINNLFEYLNLYSVYPELEKFSKMSMFSAVDIFLLCNNGTRDKIPAKLRPKKDFRLTRNTILQLRKELDERTDMEDFVDVLFRDDTATYEDFEYLRNQYRRVKDILRIKIPGMTLAKIAEYVRYVDDYQCCPMNESVTLWNDYLRMLRLMDADLTDRRLIYTNSLKREHDKAARRASLLKSEKDMKNFSKQIEKTSYKELSFEGDKYSVVLPQSASDLLEEGRKLNHCVGSYIRRVANGETKILFVRENKDISKPCCTMEVRNNEIWQLRGFSNSAPSNRVREFITKYAKEKNLRMAI